MIDTRIVTRIATIIGTRTCVFYNQLTKDSRIIQCHLKVLYFSIPMTIAELWLEKNTRIIKYKNGWNWTTTFYSLSFSLLLVRFTMSVIRRIFNNKYDLSWMEVVNQQ